MDIDSDSDDETKTPFDIHAAIAKHIEDHSYWPSIQSIWDLSTGLPGGIDEADDKAYTIYDTVHCVDQIAARIKKHVDDATEHDTEVIDSYIAEERENISIQLAEMCQLYAQQRVHLLTQMKQRDKRIEALETQLRRNKMQQYMDLASRETNGT